MRLAFLFGLLAVVGCGGSVSSELLAAPPESDEVGAVGAAAGDGASSGAGQVLFACEGAGGAWPAPRPSRLVVEHVGGSTFRVNGEALTLARVDKAGPWMNDRVTYRLYAASGWVYWLDADGAPSEAMQLTLFRKPGERTEETTSWWVCPHPAQWAVYLREHPAALPGEFDDARLDALVTATGGKRTRF